MKGIIRLIMLFAALALVVPQIVIAQEAPAVEAVAPAAAPAVEAASAEPEVSAVGVVAPAAETTTTTPKPVWFGNVQLWEILAALVVFVWGIIKAKMKLDQSWQQKVVSFVEAGVQLTYDEFIREAKKANPDGKLTKDQIAEARKRAWEAAKEYAKEQGIDLVKQVAVEQVPVLISKVVGGLKKPAA